MFRPHALPFYISAACLLIVNAQDPARDPREIVKSLDEIGKELQKTAVELDTLLDPAVLRASAREAVAARDGANMKITDWILLWRASRMGEAGSMEPARAILQIETEATKTLGEENGAKFTNWLREKDQNVEKLLGELNRAGRQMQEIAMELSKETAKREIHAQENLQKSFDEAARAAAKAEEDLRIRAELLSKPLAERLFKIRETLDVDSLLASAAERWKLTKIESEGLRPILERYRDLEILQKNDAERAAAFAGLAKDSIVILTESRAREFELWLNGRHDALRAALDGMESVGRDARAQWARATEGVGSAIREMEQWRDTRALESQAARRDADRIVNILNTRVPTALRTIQKTAPRVFLQLQQAEPDLLQKISVINERGRLARDRAAKTLEGATAARAQALSDAQKKFAAAIAAFETTKKQNAAEWERDLQHWFVETSDTFADLAKRSRDAIDGRVDAVRKLWEGIDPSARAGGLEARERAKMKSDREREREELKRMKAELDNVQKELADIERRGAGL